MLESAIQAIASTLSASFSVPVRSTPDLESDDLAVVRDALAREPAEVALFEMNGGRFAAVFWGAEAAHILLAGPYRALTDPQDDLPRLSEIETQRLGQALMAAAPSLTGIAEQPRRLLDSSRQMEILSSAIIAISGELQLNAVLRVITDLARTFASAKYAALGVPNAEGLLETFITDGVSREVEERIGHRPRGLGLLGRLLHERNPVRLDDLSQHPDSIGFPEHHPPMKSFLGVPIIARSGEVIGSLYLAEKQAAGGFTADDEHLIELLARHAAVAIDNARLYRRLEIDERRLGQILDELPEAVMLLEQGPDRVVVMNQQARRLLDVDPALPIDLEHFCPDCVFYSASEAVVGIEETPFVRSLLTGTPAEREEMSVLTPRGKQRTLLVNSAPVELEDVVGAHISVFQDITEIRDADRIKDDFLSLVSHELRTPLTTIHGGAQLLLKEMDHLEPEIRDELLADIHQESARLSALIQNMVQLTHIRAGRIAFEPEPVLVRMLVERCVRQFAELDPGRAIRVDVGPEVVAMADADRVDEMLRNVMHNALKYTPAGTPIDVHGRVFGDVVELEVRDHGPGIPERDMAQVFDRFERGSQASSGSSGMGLGLYLVRLLVEAQGGEVAIELPEDGGTSVIFTLPRAVDE